MKKINLEHSKEYYDYSDLLADAEKPPPSDNPKNSSLSSNDGMMDRGTENYEEAVQLAKYGWKEGLERVSQFAHELESVMGERMVRKVPIHALAGYHVDVPVFLTEGYSNPEYFWASEDKETKGVGRILSIVINISASWTVPASAIEHRGACAAALVDCLEHQGIQCEVWLKHAVDVSGCGHCEQNVCVKKAGQHMEMDRMVFQVAHAASLRRITFRLMEHLNIPKHDYGYGIPTSVADKGDIYFPELCNAGKFGSFEGCLEFLTEHLREQGIELAE